MIDLKKWIDEVSNRLKVIYVVEKKTIGAFTYTKYSDGTVVATRRDSLSLSHYTTFANAFGVYRVSFQIPKDIFISVDYLLCDCVIGSGFAMFAGHCRTLQPQGVTLYALSSQTGTVETVWTFEIHGRWK